jgi:AcrR family transcriptional regulator
VPGQVRTITRKVSPELGLREQNKIEKRDRIRRATRELFSKNGYDDTTLRQIAKRAHVGLGTLFNYVHDKGDLIFLICSEDLANVLDEALASVKTMPPDQALVDTIVEIFRPHYEYFSKDPAISRLAIKELGWFTEGKQAEYFYKTARRLMAAIEDLVRKAQEHGQISSKEDAATIAHLIFLVSFGAIRWWILGHFPEPSTGLTELRRMLEVQFNGFRRQPEAKNT